MSDDTCSPVRPISSRNYNAAQRLSTKSDSRNTIAHLLEQTKAHDKQVYDIINLPHHVSMRHPHMTMTQRAAQFAPFAALVGHDKAIEETARRNKRELRQATC